MSPSQSAITQWGCGFDTLWGVDPGDLRLPPWLAKGVEVWTGFLTQGWKLILPVIAGPRRWPKGQHSLRPGSMSQSQSFKTERRWGLHTLRRGINPGKLFFRPLVIVVQDVKRMF